MAARIAVKGLVMRYIARVGLCGSMVALFALLPGHAQRALVTTYHLSQDIVQVPFDYVRHQILVKGDAEGKTGLTFLFDTGASAPVLAKSLLVTGRVERDEVIHEAEGSMQGQSEWIDSLKLGAGPDTVSATGIRVLTADIEQLSRLLKRRVDGIVGITFMAGFVCEIDYPARLLRFYDPHRYTALTRTPDNQRTFSFDLQETDPSQPESTVYIRGFLHEKYAYNFLVDTGFGGFVSVAQEAATEAGLLTPTTRRIAATNYSVTDQFRSDKIRASYLKLGPIDLSGAVIQIDYRGAGAHNLSGIVGNRFLQNYRLTLDYPRKKLWMERVTDRQEPDDSDRLSLGVVARADGGTLMVERVAPFSPAQKSGVRPGDRIVTIDGKSVSVLGAADAIRLLQSPDRETALGLIRGVDPNLGTGGGSAVITITALSPLDWPVD